MFNPEKIRSDFPIFLNRKINGYPLIYFDNAATSHKPNSVIKSQNIFYSKNYSSVHRSIHTLSNEATYCIEEARKKISKFINANSEKEIIFTKGTTEGINLISNIWGMYWLKKNDNIIITQMEHHSNIIPWQIISKRIGIKIKVIPILENGELDLSKIDKLIDKNTKIFTICHVSNVLGTINPIKKIILKIKKINSNIVTIVDGAQAVIHNKVDVKDINCDFYVFSGHKIYGPNGIGILYGKEKYLKNMPPWEGGGGMVKSIKLNDNLDTLYEDYPLKFEAGTPNICGIIGIEKAISYCSNIGLEKIKIHEKNLTKYVISKLKNVSSRIIIYGPKKRIGIISFNIVDCHAYDIGILLDKYGISIRTGHHCAMPIMNYYKVSSMCRLSLAIYNNKKEIDYFISCLTKIINLLK